MEMEEIATYIDEAITHKDDESFLTALSEKVKELTKRFPIYND